MKKIFTVLAMIFVMAAGAFAGGPRKEPEKATLDYQEYVVGSPDVVLYVGNKHKEVEEWYAIFDEDLQDFFRTLDDDPNWVLGDEFITKFKQLDKFLEEGGFDALAVNEGLYLYNISNHNAYIDLNIVYVECKNGKEKLIEYTYVYGNKPVLNKISTNFVQYLNEVEARQKAYTDALIERTYGY